MEEWKSIPKYEGVYEISNLGRIKRVGKEVCLKPWKHKSGYMIVDLCKNGIQTNYKVHRLVMLAFVGESELTVNHKNENRADNRLCNLEYMTNKDNIAYSQGIKVHVTFKDGTEMCFDSYGDAGKFLKSPRDSIGKIARGERTGVLFKERHNIEKIEFKGR